MDRILAFPFKVLLFIVGHLPWFLLKALSRICFFLLYYFPSYRRDVTRLNLLYALPDIRGEQLKKIEKAYYLHLSELIFEIIKGYYMSQEELKKRFSMSERTRNTLKKWEENQRNGLMLTGHYGNWEWANLFGSYASTLPSYGVYAPMSNRAWNDYFLKKRCRWGCIMLTPRQVKTGLLSPPAQGSMSGLVADQSPTGRVTTFESRFLGLNTSFFVGPEMLSEQLQADVVYVSMKKIAFGRYSADFIEVGDVKTTSSSHILPKYIELLEADINKAPEFWIWTHKRWKGQIPY